MAKPIIEKLYNAGDITPVFTALSQNFYSFFLDSALSSKKLGRFSFLGCDPFLVFKSKGDSITLESKAGKKESFKANPFSTLKEIFEKYSCESSNSKLPFLCGGVGYFSYDLKNFIEELSDKAVDDLKNPDCIMGFYDVVIIYDNLSGQAYIASSGLPESGAKLIRRRCDRLKEFKAKMRTRNCRAGLNLPCNEMSSTKKLKSNFSKSDYIKTIEKAKRYIRKGDIYQVNISQRFETEIDSSPENLYLRLRSVSPAPFASYLGFGDISVMSSSPERFLLKRGGYIETRPIKGTRPRGTSAASDLLLEHELKKSVKDNAEHIMIVDLERNDLGRICDYGTVLPSESAVVEKYSNVSHLVSTVKGKLRREVDPIDCFLAAFPGGSITGAPKVRSMEIIEELENVKRSIYTGAIGYISFDGNMDTSIAIRTLVAKNNKAYFSVGGGIVADSDPESEYQETLDKAAGIFQALGGIPSLFRTSCSQ
jgi:para-aminobenzoate synthetase component 1